MSILEQGARQLLNGMRNYAGVRVTYVRNDKSVSVLSVPGRVVSSVYDETGVMLRAISRDFIIDRADLEDFDPPVPQRGDKIIQSVGSAKNETFIVAGEDLGTTHYEEADSYGVAWRIHTKRDKHA